MGIKERLQQIEYFKNQNLEYAFDGLTEVLNRETIFGYIKHLIQEKIPFSVCLSDIDNFKYVNDTYGHMIGDGLLYEFAQKIVSSIGDKCVIGRYGGDEFIFVAEGIVEYQDIWDICHKISKDMSKMQFKRHEELSITVTTGVSRYPIDAVEYDSLIMTADKALYRGKQKGRNCFIIYLKDKHEAIVHTPETESVYNSMDLHAKIFKIMTANQSIKDNIKHLLTFLSTTLMLDHICLENESEIIHSIVHPLSTVKKFYPLGLKLIEDAGNGIGLLYINQKKTLKVHNKELYENCDKQGVRSLFCCTIESFGKKYGVLRVDTTGKERIWQASEMDLLVTAAKLLGVILYYQNKDFNDLN